MITRSIGLSNSEFRNLPQDLFGVLFSYLDIKDLKNIGLVSRIFRKESEIRLVALLANRIDVPIKPGTNLKEFKPLLTLKGKVDDFHKKYIVKYNQNREIHIEYRDINDPHKDYMRIHWHLLVHKGSDQPYFKSYSQILTQEFKDPHQQIAAFAMHHLPNNIWFSNFYFSYPIEEYEEIRSAWKDGNGQIYFGNYIPERLAREDNRYRAWFLGV
jgi:hypothetical protein